MTISVRPRLLLFLHVVLLVAGTLASGLSRADFARAVADFEAGRFEASAQAFERMAWVGHAPSQSNLALQYAKGQGVPRDFGRAAGWAGIAADAGLEAAGRLRTQLLPALTSADMDAAIALEKQYQAAALEARINWPETLRASPRFVRPQPAGSIHIKYPDHLAGRNSSGEVWEGFVIAAVSIDAEGKPSDPVVLLGDPPRKFDPAAVQGLLGAQWRPATLDGQPVNGVACRSIGFRMPGSGADENSQLKTSMQKLRESANGGDVPSQFAAALLWAHYPDAQRYFDQDSAQRWALNALEAGFAPALLAVDRCGLSDKFDAEVRTLAYRSAEGGVLRSARLGFMPAQIVVADALLAGELPGIKGVSLEQRTRRALDWLEIAADDPKQPIARIRLAHLLATTPVDELRNPERARVVVAPVRAEWAFDPMVKAVYATAN